MVQVEKVLWAAPDDWVLGHADAVAFAGQQYAAEVVRKVGLDPRRCRFVAVPVDLERFHPTDAPMGHPPLILGVGQLTQNKDWPTFLQTLAAMTGVHDFTARIVGSGPEEGHIRDMARKLGLADRLSIVPFAADMPAQYRDATIYLSTSVREGLSIAAAEACASGLPMVLSDVSGSDVLVQDGVNGFVVPSGRPDAAARALACVLSDRDVRARMSEASRGIAEAQFAREPVGRVYKALMECAVRLAECD